mmetsp:Transcript_41405/g.82921  ORF Transcript_41405/g.82921 Transcript_41405/m.82921 type:complete len:494 (+) Transcript_41405:13-1494(+)
MAAAYGTMPSAFARPGPRRGVRRVVTAAIGLALCAIAAVALVFSWHGSNEPVELLDIAKMEHDMFSNPSKIYQQTLSDAVHHHDGEWAMAWAHPQWKADERRRKSELSAMEKDIVNGVTKQLASSVSHQVTKDVARMLEARGQLPNQNQYLLSKMRATINSDKAKLAKDLAAAKVLKTGHAGASSLANSYEHPITVHEPSPKTAPFFDDVAPTVSGPSDTHSYWLGDHYHDQEGPPGVDTGLETETAAPTEPEESEEEDGAGDKDEAAAGVSDEEAAKFWAERDNRVKLEHAGVRVQTAFPDLVAKDQDHPDSGDTPLNNGGVVTDALPGLGHGYKKAIPSVFYEHDPTPEQESAALEKGHRYISPQAEKMENDLNVNLAGPAWGLYGPADKTTKMDDKQEAWPYMDGMEDSIQNSHTARKHKPLTFWLHDPHRGSHKLEKHGINVWGEPVSMAIPDGLFDSEKDNGAETLKKAGVTVSRLSMVPKKGPGPFD